MARQVLFQIREPIANETAFQLDVGRAATLRAPVSQRAYKNAEKLSSLLRREQRFRSAVHPPASLVACGDRLPTVARKPGDPESRCDSVRGPGPDSDSGSADESHSRSGALVSQKEPSYQLTRLVLLSRNRKERDLQGHVLNQDANLVPEVEQVRIAHAIQTRELIDSQA